jgi:putative toxin-antitoxin system antitoxin component (TIGR02293 family)
VRRLEQREFRTLKDFGRARWESGPIEIRIPETQMYAAVLRPCPSKEMFMLSVFESPGGESPWLSAHQCCVGLPAGGTFTFKDALMLTRDELDKLLDVDVERLAQGPTDGRALDLFTRRRLVRCARLFALALHVLGDRSAAARWLKSPQPELGGSVPLLLAQTEVGARTVERVLGRIERGGQAS